MTGKTKKEGGFSEIRKITLVGNYSSSIILPIWIVRRWVCEWVSMKDNGKEVIIRPYYDKKKRKPEVKK